MNRPHLLQRQFRLKVLLLLAFLLFAIISFLSKKPYAVISATSDILSYRVTRKEVAAIPLKDAILRSDDFSFVPKNINNEQASFTGILKPATGAIVHYRAKHDLISIVVEGGASSSGSFYSSDGTEYTLGPRAMFVICASPNTLHFPIAGPAEIGQEFGVIDPIHQSSHTPTPIMSKGTVLIFGRGRIWPYSQDLYPINGGSFTLPAGGRLSSGGTLIPGESSKEEPWFGIATTTPEGFSISATTLSSSLRIYRMGSSGESENFALSVWTQTISDPVFQLGITIVGFIYALLESVKLIKDMLREQPKNEK